MERMKGLGQAIEGPDKGPKSPEELLAEIGQLEKDLASKLSPEEVARFMDHSDVEKAEPSRLEKIQNAYDRAKNAINTVSASLTAGSLSAFFVAMHYSPKGMLDIDVNVYENALEKVQTMGNVGAVASAAAIAVFVFGHLGNTINRRVKEGF